MQAVAQTERMKEPPDSKFRLRVLATDFCHDPTSNGFRKAIHTTPSNHLQADVLRHGRKISQAEGNKGQLFP